MEVEARTGEEKKSEPDIQKTRLRIANFPRFATSDTVNTIDRALAELCLAAM